MLHAFKVLVVQSEITNRYSRSIPSDNQTLGEGKEALLEFSDRGFQYGDGCFTTMYCEENRITLFEQHISRLVTDAAKLKMHVDMAQVKLAVESALDAVVSKNKSTMAIKLILTRGIGGRGYEVPQDPLLHLYISFHSCVKHTEYKNNEYRVQACSFPLAVQTVLAGAKHLNRLEQVMAKHELQHLSQNAKIRNLNMVDSNKGVNIHDLLMLDTEGNIIEFTAGNLFFLKEGIWHTPKLDFCGVDGIMRQAFLKFLKANNICHAVGNFTKDDLLTAESLLMCNAIKHLIVVSELLPSAKDEFLAKQFNLKPLQALHEQFCHYLSKHNRTF